MASSDSSSTPLESEPVEPDASGASGAFAAKAYGVIEGGDDQPDARDDISLSASADERESRDHERASDDKDDQVDAAAGVDGHPMGSGSTGSAAAAANHTEYIPGFARPQTHKLAPVVFDIRKFVPPEEDVEWEVELKPQSALGLPITVKGRFCRNQRYGFENQACGTAVYSAKLNIGETTHDVVVKRFAFPSGLHPDDAEKRMRQLDQEFRALEQLSRRSRYVVRHNYLIEIKADRTSYLGMVLERCKSNLAQWLESEGGSGANRSHLRMVMRQLLHAYSDCHRAGICHRDVKAENVLIVDLLGKVEVRLCDFALSRCLHVESTATEYGKNQMVTYIGNDVDAIWVAPEVLQNKDAGMRVPYSISCDVWSLACMLFFVANRGAKHLFYSRRDAETAMADVKEQQTFVSRGNHHAEFPHLDHLLGQMLLAPDKRVDLTEDWTKFHPCTWSTTNIEYVVNHFGNKFRDKQPPFDKFSQRLDDVMKARFPGWDWYPCLPQSHQDVIRQDDFWNRVARNPSDGYRFRASILVTVFRNILQHYGEFAVGIGTEDMHDQVITEFTRSFPTLLTDLYVIGWEIGTWEPTDELITFKPSQ